MPRPDVSVQIGPPQPGPSSSSVTALDAHFGAPARRRSSIDADAARSYARRRSMSASSPLSSDPYPVLPPPASSTFTPRPPPSSSRWGLGMGGAPLLSSRQALRRPLAFLPPSLRRLASSRLALALLSLLGVLALLSLVAPGRGPIGLFSSRPPVIRESYGGQRSYVGPDLALDPPHPLAPLPDAYNAFFPAGQLPAVLRTRTNLPVAQKLDEFLRRPALDHAAAYERNHAGCPDRVSGQLVNPDQYKSEHRFWEGLSVRQILEQRVEIVRYLAEWVERTGPIVGDRQGASGAGRGIVMTGGNQDTTLRLLTTLRHLQALGNDLPIEVFHYPDEMQNPDERRQVEELGGKLIQAVGVQKASGVWKNWQIKGLALIQSSFRELIYLDSDNVPLRTLTHLFSAPLYLEGGHHAVFWPDLSKDSPDNSIWRIMGDTCALNHWTFESGQIVYDKAGNGGLNLAALVVAAMMQDKRDFWFKMCGGDKDTFRWGFRVLDIEWRDSPRWMATAGIKEASGQFCGHSVIQHDLVVPEGLDREPPLFVHMNLMKHLGSGGLRNGNTFTHMKRMRDDRYSNAVLNHARSWVYHGARGMCLDLAWHGTAEEDLSAAQMGASGPELVGLDEVEGRVFEGFEGLWYNHGGRVGGW